MKLHSTIDRYTTQRSTHSLTFCWRQSLHARFTPGWCRGLLPFALLVGLPALMLPSAPSAPPPSALSCSTPPRELRFRLRLRDASSGLAAMGVVVVAGEVWCGETRPADGGSNAVPLCQDIWLQLRTRPEAFGVLLRCREGTKSAISLRSCFGAKHHVKGRGVTREFRDGSSEVCRHIQLTTLSNHSPTDIAGTCGIHMHPLVPRILPHHVQMPPLPQILQNPHISHAPLAQPQQHFSALAAARMRNLRSRLCET